MIHVHTMYNKISSCIALSKPSSQRKLALITHHSMNFFARWMGGGGGTYRHCRSTADALCSSGVDPSDCVGRASDRPPPHGPDSPPAAAPPSGHLKMAQWLILRIKAERWERVCACTQMCVLLIMNFVQRIYLFTQLYSSNTCSFPLDTNISPIVTKG